MEHDKSLLVLSNDKKVPLDTTWKSLNGIGGLAKVPTPSPAKPTQQPAASTPAQSTGTGGTTDKK
jgi:hypothetical protein